MPVSECSGCSPVKDISGQSWPCDLGFVPPFLNVFWLRVTATYGVAGCSTKFTHEVINNI
jgi:hypothetical protein